MPFVERGVFYAVLAACEIKIGKSSGCQRGSTSGSSAAQGMYAGARLPPFLESGRLPKFPSSVLLRVAISAKIGRQCSSEARILFANFSIGFLAHSQPFQLLPPSARMLPQESFLGSIPALSVAFLPFRIRLQYKPLSRIEDDMLPSCHAQFANAAHGRKH